MNDQIKVLREMLAKVSGLPIPRNEVDRFERAIRDLERAPREPLLLALPDGLTLKTQEATCHEDLPWDACVLGKDGKLLEWADGQTEIEALKRVLAKARAGGKLQQAGELART